MPSSSCARSIALVRPVPWRISSPISSVSLAAAAVKLLLLGVIAHESVDLRRELLEEFFLTALQMHARLEVVGLTDGMSYTLPLTQADIAECTGLTPIHVNRTLRELRERGLVQFKSGRLTISDWQGLAAVGEFDPSYLYIRKRHV